MEVILYVTTSIFICCGFFAVYIANKDHTVTPNETEDGIIGWNDLHTMD